MVFEHGHRIIMHPNDRFFYLFTVKRIDWKFVEEIRL